MRIHIIRTIRLVKLNQNQQDISCSFYPTQEAYLSVTHPDNVKHSETNQTPIWLIYICLNYEKPNFLVFDIAPSNSSLHQLPIKKIH